MIMEGVSTPVLTQEVHISVNVRVDTNSPMIEDHVLVCECIEPYRL